jgi:hypothetical protein
VIKSRVKHGWKIKALGFVSFLFIFIKFGCGVNKVVS